MNEAFIRYIGKELSASLLLFPTSTIESKMNNAWTRGSTLFVFLDWLLMLAKTTSYLLLLKQTSFPMKDIMWITIQLEDSLMEILQLTLHMFYFSILVYCQTGKKCCWWWCSEQDSSEVPRWYKSFFWESHYWRGIYFLLVNFTSLVDINAWKL